MLTLTRAAHEGLYSLMLSSQCLLLTHLPIMCLAQVMPQEEGKTPELEVDPVMTHAHLDGAHLDSILAYQEVHHRHKTIGIPFNSILLSSL